MDTDSKINKKGDIIDERLKFDDTDLFFVYALISRAFVHSQTQKR